MARCCACGHADGMASPRLTIGRHSCIGSCYVVTTVLRNRLPLFNDARCARAVVSEIHALHGEHRVDSLAWTLMPDHLHWLFRLREGSLAACLQRLKSRSARAVNAIRRSHGSLWQSGYYDHQIRNERMLRRQVLYMLANPLRAGLVETLADYPHWECRWPGVEADLACLSGTACGPVRD